MTAIAQDPSSRAVWYHGTGEFSGNSAGGGSTLYAGQGLFKSTDGGVTWAQLPATAPGSRNTFDAFFDIVWNVAVHPQTRTVFAATYAGIMRSADGGASWQQTLGRTQSPYSQMTDVAIAADGSIYATLSRNGGGFAEFGVYRSTNDGVSWTSVSPPTLTADPYRMVLGTAPSDANTVYVFVQKNQTADKPEDHQLLRYNAGANTWTDRSPGLKNETGFGGEFSTQGGYDMLVRVKPDDPNTIWVGGTNLYRSTDGGAAFTRVAGYATDPNSRTGQYPNHHPDQHAVVFFPNNPNALLSGHDGGISKAANALQQPQQWTFLNNGYLTTQFYAVAVDPRGGDLIAGGLQDNGSWITEAASPTQLWQDVLTGDGGFAAVAPGGFPLYVSSQNGNVVRISQQNGQAAYSLVKPAGETNFQFITPYLLDPNDARVMYLAGGNTVWRNSNLDGIAVGNQQPTATNWTKLTGSAVGAATTHRVTTLAVSTAPANRLYFGATNSQNETVLKRVDNPAANPAGVVITPPGLTAGAYPSSIAIHPANADEIIATFSNYNVVSVWHSANGGTSWTNIEGTLSGNDGPSVRSAAIVPTASGTLYLLGTSTGVYSATQLSGAATAWAQEAPGLIGNVVTDMIVARPSDGLIVAATHGRGVYSAKVGAGGAAVASADVQQLRFGVLPGTVGRGTFTLRNTGTAALNYTLTARQTPGVAHRFPEGGGLTFPPTVPAWTAADVPKMRGAGMPSASAPAAGASASQPPPAGVLYLDDGDETADTFIGFGDGTLVQALNEFDLTTGYRLDRVQFHMRTENSTTNDVVVTVYDRSGNALQSVGRSLPTSPGGRFFDVALTTPLTFAARDTFYVEVAMIGFYAFPAGTDTDARVAGKSFYFDGNAGRYVNINTIQGFQNAALLIRAVGENVGSANQPPVARGSISPGQPQAGQTVTFDASTSSDADGQIVGYRWAFGDGVTSTQAVATHAYAAAGTYTITLTVTDNQGATGQISAPITVSGGGGGNTPPVARASVSKSQAATGETVTFDGSGSTDADGQIVGYRWTFGDGVSSTQALATHAYAAAGTYTATLTVTDNGGATGQASGTVTVTATGTSRLTVAPTQGTLAPGAAQSVTVTFDATGLGESTQRGEIVVAGNAAGLTIPVEVTVSPTVGVDDEAEASGIRLAQNAPNPVTGETTIRYTLAAPAEVSLSVYDITGRLVATLDAGAKSPGAYAVLWNGRGGDGSPLASGLYLYRLDVRRGAATTVRTRSMVLVR